jgi:hypothetical protein
MSARALLAVKSARKKQTSTAVAVSAASILHAIDASDCDVDDEDATVSRSAGVDDDIASVNGAVAVHDTPVRQKSRHHRRRVPIFQSYRAIADPSALPTGTPLCKSIAKAAVSPVRPGRPSTGTINGDSYFGPVQVTDARDLVGRQRKNRANKLPRHVSVLTNREIADALVTSGVDGSYGQLRNVSDHSFSFLLVNPAVFEKASVRVQCDCQYPGPPSLNFFSSWQLPRLW